MNSNDQERLVKFLIQGFLLFMLGMSAVFAQSQPPLQRSYSLQRYLQKSAREFDANKQHAPAIFSQVHYSDAADSNTTLLGRWGYGPCLSVAVAGNIVYAGVGSYFMVVDVSNPQNPQEAGKVLLSSGAAAIELRNNYAYVADVFHGLQIIDIGNSSAPVLYGSVNIPGFTLDVTLNGDYAYMAVADSGFQVIDISKPASPTLRGRINTPDNAQGVAVSGSYAYVAVNNSGFQVIDISNPDLPALRGRVNTPYRTRGVALNGNYAYVTVDDSGLQVIDIGNPDLPALQGRVNTPTDALGITISGGYAYVTCLGSGLQIVDITSPNNPVEVGYWKMPGIQLARDVAVNGNYAYLSNWGDGLQIINISAPNNPLAEGHLDTPGNSEEVVLHNSHAYLLVLEDYNESNLYVLDINPIPQPIHKKTLNLPIQFDHMVGNSTYLYLASYSPDSVFQIVDISNPVNPVLRGSLNNLRGGSDIAASGNYVYIVNNGLQAIDVSNPDNPTLRGFISVSFNHAAISGNYAYGISYDSLQIIDVSKPDNLVKRGALKITGQSNDVAVRGSYVYVISDDHLHIIDVSIASNPVLRGRLGLEEPSNIAVSGNYVYVSNWNNELRIIDVNDPDNPVMHGFSSGIEVSSIAIDKNIAYLATGWQGLYIVRNNVTPVAVSLGSKSIPVAYTLHQNHPNPFNPTTTIGYFLPKTSRVTLAVYNLLGQKVVTLIQGAQKTAGNHQINFNASHLSSGMYFYRLEGEGFSKIQKMMLLK